ncbi:MAG: hypothetical protein HY904_04595 [Deltaproteobacteria bacterium]|nr:hypothetical protein [Deltaproteobacteria bacterium]
MKTGVASKSLGVCAALAATWAWTSACDISADCLPWFSGVGCFDTDLGAKCSSDEATLKRVTVKPNSNDVVSDPGFENCESFYCASTNGSRPYCTRRCASDFDCNPGLPCPPNAPDDEQCRRRDRSNWSCGVVIEFGALACSSVDPETGSCELDPVTGKVKSPAKYCRVADGVVDVGELNEPTASVATDGGP